MHMVNEMFLQRSSYPWGAICRVFAFFLLLGHVDPIFIPLLCAMKICVRASRHFSLSEQLHLLFCCFVPICYFGAFSLAKASDLLCS